MAKIIQCDRCKKTTEDPVKDGYCKILVYKGMGFHRKSQGSSYTHHHFCKQCKGELFKK